MTVRALQYHGDGSYYLADRALELDGLREGGPGRALSTDGEAGQVLTALLAECGSAGALDLVVAAPKPMSVLLATERPEVASRLVVLHERAVLDTLRYLDEEALGAAGVTAVMFTHGINRHCDPHLHSHVLVGTTSRAGRDLDTASLRRSARSADALYLAAMRDGLPGATGRRAWCSSRDTVLVEGVDAGLVAAASAPRHRDGRVERAGDKPRPTRDEVRRHWDDLVARGRVGLVPTPPPAKDAIDEYRFARALGAGVVARRDVLAAWATACTFGAPVDTVRAAVRVAAPGITASGRCPARAVTDHPGVRAIGPRPVAPAALQRWQTGRAALDRYLAGGHPLRHALDPGRAAPGTRLAVAQLDATLRSLGLSVAHERPVASLGRDLS